jgi:glycosyltransferase involved in cell wall biosynthesis
VHVLAVARALADAIGPVDLVSVAPPRPEPADPGSAEARAAAPPAAPPTAELPGNVRAWPLPAPGANLIERVLDFRRQLVAWWQSRARRPAVAHVRSIYEGYPLARAGRAAAQRLVFEVNGLPSIELKYHYSQVADDRELFAKLEAQEQACLDAADLVVTPSRVTAELLAGRGVEASRLRVVPNGVDLERFPSRPPCPFPTDRPLRLLYVGTLTAWQGLPHALEALALYVRDLPAELTVVGPGRPRQLRELEAHCHDLGISGRVRFERPRAQTELAALYREHDVALAPLPPNDRNLVQGCCPLKVLEAMASGIPLVASELPVVTDLTGEHAVLVRPGSGKALKDGLLRLREEAGLAERLVAAARRRVEESFTWEYSDQRLLAAYAEVLGLRAREPGPAQ